MFIELTDCYQKKQRSKPWTSRFKAAFSEALGLNVANGRRLGSPIFGTQVPKGIAQIGNWRIGNDPEEFLKYLHIPEKQNPTSVNAKHTTFILRKTFDTYILVFQIEMQDTTAVDMNPLPNLNE